MILIDMDGVLVDWDAGFKKVWGDRPLGPRSHYEMEECVRKEDAEEAKAMYTSKGFFLNLPPMRGALDAISEIASRGYIVHICTKPVLSPYCVQEKYEWVRKHLGEEWMTRIIMTHDKTVIRGTLLIDDHPNIRGSRFPSWRQLIFDAPYNRHRTDLPRLSSWSNWEKLFAEELLFAPKPPPIKAEELAKLPRGKKRYSVIRNLSWSSQMAKSFGSEQLQSQDLRLDGIRETHENETQTVGVDA